MYNGNGIDVCSLLGEGEYGIPLYMKHDGKIYAIDNFPKYSTLNE